LFFFDSQQKKKEKKNNFARQQLYVKRDSRRVWKNYLKNKKTCRTCPCPENCRRPEHPASVVGRLLRRRRRQGHRRHRLHREPPQQDQGSMLYNRSLLPHTGLYTKSYQVFSLCTNVWFIPTCTYPCTYMYVGKKFRKLRKQSWPITILT
jgi:hypothetical protein